MRRFISVSKSSTSSPLPPTIFEDLFEDHGSRTATARDDEVLPAPSLKVKRVDYYYSRWGKTWKYRNMSSKVTVETIPMLQSGKDDPWKDYSFVFVRKIPKLEHQEPTFKIIVKSGYILKACQDVIKTWPGISWNADPLEVLLEYVHFYLKLLMVSALQLDPEMFITFYDKFVEYRDGLTSKKPKTERETHVLSSVNLLLSTIATDYRTTLSTLDRLTSAGEITFDLLYAILVPRTLFFATCAITGKPRLFRLTSAIRSTVDGKPVYCLQCESNDLVDRQTQAASIGVVQTTILVRFFKGTIKIQDLDIYPLKFYHEPEKLRATLLQRGKKWLSLNGVHHMQYNGIAAFKSDCKVTKQHVGVLQINFVPLLIHLQVDSRIMVDRATFRRMNPNYSFPMASTVAAYPMAYPAPQASVESLWGNGRMPPPPLPSQSVPLPIVPFQATPQWSSPYANSLGPGSLVQSTSANEESTNDGPTEEDLILTPTVVYGFSLSDKTWLEFDIEKVGPVKWNEDAFANLVLPSDRKDLLRSLVEAHHRELGFDDFIKGKGHGLVINLFGPPGVGKTFSAEATSEHVRRPLYVIGGGDLGTRASAMDASLERIFDVATAWKAIVLIDEADVFLEQRSLHDLERNAMVAVFLRHVEYYRGILFLTTNRVQAFDEAFLSRIHVALHFYELTQTSKEQVWAAFIAKLRVPHVITPEQVKELASRNINGRQIKNAVRTAQSLAVGRGETIEYRHFVETLDAMDGFTKEFQVLRKDYQQ
ncbi:hypothetical protein H0H92_001548 [Tricholoma furcatifolium]|nr:hypothetical protein H0H92_001548 [Tricholoma furcatifolium]